MFGNGTLACVSAASVASAVTLEVAHGSSQTIRSDVSRRLGAANAHASYFKWFGGLPDGREQICFVFYGDRPCWGTIKGGVQVQ